MAKPDDKTPKDWEEITEQAVTDEPPVASKVSEAEMDETPTLGGALEHPSYKALEEKLTEMEAKAHENWDKAVRAVSELDNFRKRAERDISNTHKYSIEKFAAALIPVIDSLEQATVASQQVGQDVTSLRQGVELTLQMFNGVLEKFSIEILEPVGQPFDPNHHEAMTMQPAPDVAPNTVIQVLQKGYKLNDRLLRPARVIVAKGSSEARDKDE